MTYPNQPGYPPAPPQQYPPQQQYPGYPPQQYPAPQPGYPAPPPPAPAEKATLGDFWDQPAGGSKPLQWNTPGTTYTFVVSRPITDADTEVQRDKQNQVKRFRDGTAMKVLKIPCLMNPTAEYPDGTADFYVKGNDTAELKRALGEAGMDPGKPPPMGTLITVQYTHDRPVPGGFNPAKVKRITIQGPQGMPEHAAQGNGQQAPALQPVPQPVPQPAPPVGQQPVPQPQGQVQPQWPAPGAPLSVPPQPAPPGENPYNNPALPPNQPPATGMAGPAEQIASATQAGVTARDAAQQPPAQAPQMAPPPGMSPENAALLAQLTGQAPPQ
jgi:hypothetical protein